MIFLTPPPLYKRTIFSYHQCFLDHSFRFIFLICILFIHFWLCSMWDPWTRDRNCAPCHGSLESSPLDLQGSPLLVLDPNSRLTKPWPPSWGEMTVSGISESHLYLQLTGKPTSMQTHFLIKNCEMLPRLILRKLLSVFFHYLDLLYQRLFFSFFI